MKTTKADVRAELGLYAAKLHLSSQEIIGFNTAVDGGTPFIEIAPDGLMHWKVVERGQVLQDRSTEDLDELLYWTFKSATFSLASRDELNGRVEGEDSRIGLWARQYRMLLTLNPRWAFRWRKELEENQPGDVGLMPGARRPPVPAAEANMSAKRSSVGRRGGQQLRAMIL